MTITTNTISVYESGTFSFIRRVAIFKKNTGALLHKGWKNFTTLTREHKNGIKISLSGLGLGLGFSFLPLSEKKVEVLPPIISLNDLQDKALPLFQVTMNTIFIATFCIQSRPGREGITLAMLTSLTLTMAIALLHFNLKN